MSLKGVKYQRITDKSVDDFEMSGDKRKALDHQEFLEIDSNGITMSQLSGDYLHYYNPNSQLSYIRVHEDKDINSPLRGIIRRRGLIVISQVEDSFCHVVTEQIEGWARMSLQNPNVQSAITRVRQYPKYYEWKGNNEFFCNGSIMFGKDVNVFLFTNILFIIPSVIFFAIVAPQMYFSIFWMVNYFLLYILFFTIHIFSIR